MAILKINETETPAPSRLTVRLEDVAQSVRRTIGGSACVSRAGTRRVVACTWNRLPAAELAFLLQTAAAQAVCSVSYPDPASGEERTMQAVCSERSVGLSHKTAQGLIWTQVRLVFCEV